MKNLLITTFIYLSIPSTWAMDQLACNALINSQTYFIQKSAQMINRLNQSNVKSCAEEKKDPFDLILEAALANDQLKMNAIFTAIEKTEPYTSLIKALDMILDGPQPKKGSKLQAFITSKLSSLNRLSELEKRTLKINPIRSLVVLYQYEQAENFIHSKEGDDLVKKHTIFKGVNTSTYLGTQDALRHMMINAAAARFGFHDTAILMSVSHERQAGLTSLSIQDQKKFNIATFNKSSTLPYHEYLKCNPKIKESELQKELHKNIIKKFADTSMDLHNNSLGHSIGIEHPCANMNELAELVTKKIENGEAKIILESTDHRYILAPSNTQIPTKKDQMYVEVPTINTPMLNEQKKYVCGINTPFIPGSVKK